MQFWEGNIFTRVCLFTWGSPSDHYPWCIGPHCTVPPPQALPHAYLGHHWRPVHTCSFGASGNAFLLLIKMRGSKNDQITNSYCYFFIMMRKRKHKDMNDKVLIHMQMSRSLLTNSCQLTAWFTGIFVWGV